MHNLIRHCTSPTVKVVITGVVLLLQPVFGVSPTQIENSADDLVQAIKPTIGSFPRELSHYIPGYGLHLVFKRSYGVPTLDDAIKQLSTALLKKGSTIEGLAKGEWISIFYEGSDDIYDLLVRMKQGQPDTLEVWVNGLAGD